MATATVLAFDFGTKSIGAAVGQALARTASELTPLPARDGVPNWDLMEQVLNEWVPDEVVVGLPLNMDGTESELSKRARKFANRIHGRFRVKVSMFDERLTTREAKDEARSRGHRGDYVKEPVDSIAARLLLESWWRENPPEAS